MKQPSFIYRVKIVVCIMVLGAGGILLCWLFAPVPVSEQHSVSHEQMRDATVAILGSTSNDISSTLLSRASGVLITSDGIVLTTKHSVSGDVLYQVWTHEGEQYAVSQLWRDPQHDLAVLQIRRSDGLKPQKLSFLPLPDLQSATGAVQAIGYPYDHQELIMLTGSIVGYQDTMYELAMSLSPGMSGGPVLSSDGRWIALNRAVSTYDPTRSFAIAVSQEMIQGFLDKNMTL